VFRYKMNVRKQKVLPGRFKFVVELNTERTTLRRPAQPIASVTPKFDASAFNFNKVNPVEILFECKHPNIRIPITYLINTSPLTKYHTLICPGLDKNRPQVLTAVAIKGVIDLLGDFDDPNFRIGYNSPGANASVNHLHLHLMYVEPRLYIDNHSDWKHLVHNVFVSNFPSKCYYVNVHDWSLKTETIKSIAKIVKYFCDNHIPHNLFFTYTTSRSAVMCHIYPRSQMCGTDKEYSNFNIACCELAGFISVGREDIYNVLTEEIILQRIRNEMGEIPNLDDRIIELFP